MTDKENIFHRFDSLKQHRCFPQHSRNPSVRRENSPAIADAKRGYIDEDVREEVLASVAFSNGEAGENSRVFASNLTETDGASIDYSIKNLGEVVVDGQSAGTMYSATGVQKTKTGSKELKDVNVEAYLTVVWIDNLGYDNVLVEVSGGWNDRWGYPCWRYYSKYP